MMPLPLQLPAYIDADIHLHTGLSPQGQSMPHISLQGRHSALVSLSLLGHSEQFKELHHLHLYKLSHRKKATRSLAG